MAVAADMRSGYHDLTYYAKKYRQLPQLKCPSSGDLGLVDARCVLGHLGLDLGLQVGAGHLGEAQQVDRRVGQFFAEVFAALAPGVECFGDLALEQAELQRDIGGIEPLNDFDGAVRPGVCGTC
jgi:hypothetical protein